MTTTGLGAATFRDRLKQARQTCGISLEEAAYRLRDRAPKQWQVSFASLGNWERGLVAEDRIDPFTLGVLADIYDVELEDLSPIAARNAAAMLDSLGVETPKWAARESNPEPPGKWWPPSNTQELEAIHGRAS